MKTVRATLQDQFVSRYHVSVEDIPACMQFALQEVKHKYHTLWERVAHFQGVAEEEKADVAAEFERVFDCWDRDVQEYSDAWLSRIQHEVVEAAFKWYVMRYNAQKAAIQEIHRQACTVLHLQEQRDVEEEEEVMLFQDEMEEVLHGYYGLSKEEAHACFVACRPDFLREYLELHLVDSQGRFLSEKMATCPRASLDAAKQVVDFLVSQWIEHRQTPH